MHPMDNWNLVFLKTRFLKSMRLLRIYRYNSVHWTVLYCLTQVSLTWVSEYNTVQLTELHRYARGNLIVVQK